MSRIPIRLRLTLAFGVAMAVVLVGMAALVYARLGSALMASVDQTLRSQSAEAVASVRTNTQTLIDTDVGGGTTLAQLLTLSGRVVASSRPGLAPLVRGPLAPGAKRIGSTTLTSPDGDWRYLAVHPSGFDGIVVVARSLEPREESLDHVEDEFLVTIPLALLLASLAGYLLASAALRPVEAMRRRAASVTAASDMRLPVPASSDEISRLAETLNAMLDRLQESLEHERRFVADASHELRTPLALLRTELDLALRRPRSREELEAALRSAAEETERLSRLAEGLLLMARGDRGTLQVRSEDVEVEDLLETVAARFATRARDAGVSVVVTPTGERVEADPEQLQQALGNLVDNALGHGARSIVMSAARNNGSIELHVADDGEGFPESFLERAFDRFSRADEARSRGGAGIGLSIVALIAAAHGGDARVANRADGGADAWIALPTPS
ncbi:MAG: ATP-binding protein [Actinomycetota bacterium]